MSAANVSETGQALVDRLPYFLHSAPEIVGTLDTLGREIDRMDAAVETLIANFFASTADEYLHWHERLLGLAEDPPDKTIAQRRASVLAIYASLASGGSGLAWEEDITRQIGTTWSYEEYVSGGGLSPYTIRMTLPPDTTYETVALIRSITPAHIQIGFGSPLGFLVGESAIGEVFL